MAVLGALAALAVTVSPPVDDAASTSLTAHMAQHVVLLVLVPALLAAGMRQHRTVTVAAMATAVVVESVVMAAWHAPSLYEAALRTAPVHAVEHLTMLGAGLGLWWTVSRVRPRLSGAVALFVAALSGTALGAALTLSARTWYPSYPDVGSQQLAGVVMWAFGGIPFIVAGGALVARAVARETVEPC